MIKEYNDSTWQGKAYSKIVDTTQQVTSFPVVVRPMENTIPSWTIKGNMVQDGNPSPSNIIYPSETGERTGNLFDYTKTDGIIANTYINQNGSMVTNNEYYMSYPIKVNVGETYTWRFNSDSVLTTHSAPTVGFYDSSNNLLSAAQHNVSVKYFSFEVPTNCAYIRASVFTRSNAQKGAMLNEGSTAKPYEPYGYKIPISSANTTTPVYLGKVQSTRKIKKLVLTGEEGWVRTQNQKCYYVNASTGCPTDYLKQTITTSICSHYQSQNNTASGSNEVEAGHFCFYTGGGFELYIGETTISSAADFKTYLAQQYANGTPVCVWYVLAAETTTTLNEPLRKIGTYSDSVSRTNLSVTAQSPTTIDVDTSLKPSEMDLTYTGLKMCKRKKRANGAWV